MLVEPAVFLAERRYEGFGYFVANAIIIAGIAAIVVGAISKWRGKKGGGNSMSVNTNPDEAGISEQPFPGAELPQRAGFPGETSWAVVGGIAGICIGGTFGVAIAWAVFSDFGVAGVAGPLGMVIGYWVSQDIQREIVIRKAVSYYGRLAEREPGNADAYAQAGLWNLRLNQPGAHRKRPRVPQALERSPGLRDATIALAASLLAWRQRTGSG